jgi:ElaB/YqjD/DUF883 family membrane-anchored ribosome-binding protein
MEQQTQSRLQTLLEKHSDYQPRPRGVAASFEQYGTKDLRRIGNAPSLQGLGDLGEHYKQVAGINLALIELSARNNKANAKFMHLLGKDRLFTLREYLQVKRLEWKLKGEQEDDKRDRHFAKKAQIFHSAYERRGNDISEVIDQMGEIMSERWEFSKQAVIKARGLETHSIGHMRAMDQKIIDELKSSYANDAQYAEVLVEIQKLEAELLEFDSVLEAYEAEVKQAKESGDIDKVGALTNEMTQVLDLKYSVLSNAHEAKGEASEIRRQIIDKAKGVESAKGAIAATKVNLATIATLIDSYNMMEIAYRHAISDMLPVFKVQAQIAAYSLQGFDSIDTLLQIADASSKLMEVLPQMATHLLSQSWKLVENPIYNIEKADMALTQIEGWKQQFDAYSLQWAELQQRITNLGKQSPHLSQQT